METKTSKSRNDTVWEYTPEQVDIKTSLHLLLTPAELFHLLALTRGATDPAGQTLYTKIQEAFHDRLDNPLYGWYVREAQDNSREGELEVDDNATVSQCDGGAYVMSWLWVNEPNLKEWLDNVDDLLMDMSDNELSLLLDTEQPMLINMNDDELREVKSLFTAMKEPEEAAKELFEWAKAAGHWPPTCEEG